MDPADGAHGDATHVADAPLIEELRRGGVHEGPARAVQPDRIGAVYGFEVGGVERVELLVGHLVRQPEGVEKDARGAGAVGVAGKNHDLPVRDAVQVFRGEGDDVLVG